MESGSSPALPPSPLFAVRQESGIHLITVTQPDALDSVHAEQLGEAIHEHLQAFEAPKVVLDVHNAVSLSSSALGVLISISSLIEQAGGRLCIARPSETLIAVLKMTKLEGLVEIRDSTDEAMSVLA